MDRELRTTIAVVSTTAILLFALSVSLWPFIESVSSSVGGWLGLLFWISLTLLASAYPVEAPRGASVSVSTAPILAAAFLGGPTFGAVVALVGTLELREVRGQVPWYGVLYNHLAFLHPTVLAGIVFILVAGNEPIGSVSGLMGALAGGAVFIATNVALAALVVSVRGKRSYWLVIAQEVRAFGLPWAGLTPIAWLMAVAYTLVGPLAAPVLALPLYATRSSYKAVVDMRLMFTQTVRALASAIDARDPSTKMHSDHVSEIAVDLGREMDLADDELDQLQWAGLLHDIGKIGIRDDVLLKPDRLTREERMLMNEHPAKGEEILQGVDRLARERPLIRHHHEWYNGSGYPDRLIGDEIPFLARVLHVADAFEAMTASRPYRPVPLTSSQALGELRRYAGIQFDPAVVKAFEKTKYASADEESDDGVPELPDVEATPVPLLGQVAAGRASGAIHSTSATATKP